MRGGSPRRAIAKATLELHEVRAAREVARRRGGIVLPLFDWMYEFGARASEPGLQRVLDVDLRALRARPLHLKDGTPQDWFALLPFCRESMKSWMEKGRAEVVKIPEQQTVLFPSTSPGRCYACKGTGQRPILRREKDGRRREEGTKTCYCGGTGKRFGIARGEIYTIITGVLTEVGVPETHRHPHVLRHTIITNLLEGGVPPTVIQARVGHRDLATTLGYAAGTRAAAAEIEAKMSSLYNPGDEK